MIAIRLTQKVLLAIACCFALILVPVSVGAQGGLIKKGAEGVKKGVETGVEKTKEGAGAVKKTITGEEKDTSRQKSTEPTTSPSTRSSSSSTTEPSKKEPSAASTPESKTEKGKRMPATAGELPLLALAGIGALAASGTLKLIRRV